uniref:C-type lectin domain-containing protein n=1 Tax=Sciurus vulgaris TaxID=55149 RepID=A0A8D2AJV3_SCIVU
MASEITYAEVRFKNELKSSGTNPDSPAAPKENTTPHKSNLSFPKLLLGSLLILALLLAISFFVAFIIFFKKYSQLLEEKKYTISMKNPIYTNLECVKTNWTMEGKVWSCCPKNWKSFSSSCYFISTEAKSWNESQENCSRMGSHLVVINSKEEQDFITQNMDIYAAYYVGLSDPEGQGHWQWVDQTPYNQSATFWHAGEPSYGGEHCVILNYREKRTSWGWNDCICNIRQRLVCEMMKIYL